MSAPGGPVFSYDTAFAAMCLWEEIANPVLAGAHTPWEEMRDHVGSVQLRGWVLTRLAAACDQAWTRANNSHQIEWNVWNVRRQEEEIAGRPFFDEEPQDPGGFDYEFVPFWIRTCVDWSDHQSGPRVLGSKS